MVSSSSFEPAKTLKKLLVQLDDLLGTLAEILRVRS